MSFLRPEAVRFLNRWRELAAAIGAALVGGMLMRLGGYLLFPVGAALTLMSLGWAMTALRRLSFRREVTAPGVVELDEGQVGYFGPTFGGFVALADLSELRLVDLRGVRHWRLATTGGEVLLIPVEAAGAERLFDGFAVLPGIDMAVLAAALDAGKAGAPLWRRPKAALPGH